MTATATPTTLVQRFAAALLTLDEKSLAENSTADLSWTIPGHGRVSGVHVGVPAVIAVATTIREHGITVEVDDILTGCDGVTAVLHETGDLAAPPLDVRVGLTLLVLDDQVAAMDGYISDVAAYDAYLETEPPARRPLIWERTNEALDRRPHFDQTSALQATRLGIALTAGSRS